jgi:hypothetical protein
LFAPRLAAALGTEEDKKRMMIKMKTRFRVDLLVINGAFFNFIFNGVRNFCECS